MGLEPDIEVARKIADLLIRALHPSRIVWFGSRARGQAGPESDFDFLVVVDTNEPLGERLVRANLATRDVEVAKDILVLTPAEHAKYSGWPSSVVYEAEATGRVLHEAA
jgi:uncharacterized protein